MSASHRHFADEDTVPTVPTCPPHICTRRAFWPKIVLIGEHFSFESGDKDGDGQANEDDGGSQANEGESGHESGHESFCKDGDDGQANKGDGGSQANEGHENGHESGDKDGGGQANEGDGDGKANEGDKSGHESGHDFESFAKKKNQKSCQRR